MSNDTMVGGVVGKKEGHTSTGKPDSRYAAIKSEFLISKKKEIDLDFIASTGDTSDDGQPPSKKGKYKGRNKQRPHQRINNKDKLCYSVIHGVPCQHADQCKYLHDSKLFLEKQPPDIGDRCPIYSQYGICSKGVTCRYARSHITEDGENKVDLEKQKTVSPLESHYKNFLLPDLRVKLRHRTYDFTRAASCSQYYIDRTKPASETSFQLPGAIFKDDLTTSLDTKPSGAVTDEDVIPLRPAERPRLDLRDKLYLAPLTTVGNLPFRRVCRNLGVDVTCGEMALATNLLQGSMSEWALVRRHESETCFGVQIAGGHADSMSRCAQLLCEQAQVDFIDINVGCPIDLICNKGAGSGLMAKKTRFETVVKSMSGVCTVPLTCKIRTGIQECKNIAHTIVPNLSSWGIDLVTLHGRSKEQRYTRLADWSYIGRCKSVCTAHEERDILFFGNGDVLSYDDYVRCKEASGVDGIMIARGALIKPWIFTEIKECRNWDISASERFDQLRDFANYGLEHWGSDAQGVQTTRKFLLEWLSFTHRYIPVGLLERLPQRINEQPPSYVGRNDLETLLSSSYCGDWIKISEMLLGPVPDGFTFLPKHKANAYKT